MNRCVQSGLRRPLLLLALLVVLALVVPLYFPRAALAFVPGPVGLPSSVLEALGVGTGEGVATAAGGGVVAGDVAAGGAVAGAGVALPLTAAVGAGLLLGYGLYKGGKWGYDNRHVINGDAGQDGVQGDYCWFTGVGSGVTPQDCSYDRAGGLLRAHFVSNRNLYSVRLRDGKPHDPADYPYGDQAGNCSQGNNCQVYTSPPPASATQAELDASWNAIEYHYIGEGGGYPCNVEPSATTPCVDGGEAFTLHIQLPGSTDGPAASDPARHLETTGECLTGSGSTVTVTADSAVFHETDQSFPDMPAVTCPDGSQLQSVRVVELGGPQPIEIMSWDAPDAYKAIPSKYPDCAGGTCVLRLYRVDPQGHRVDCFENPDVCADWASDDNQDQDYACYYGSYLVELSECDVYTPTFESISSTGTITYAPPGSGTKTSGGSETGQPKADCPPDFGLSILTPWWAWKAGVCVLESAFVPTAATASDLDALRDDVESRPPGSVVLGVGGSFEGIFTGWDGGCTQFPDFDPAQDGRLRLPCVPPGGPAYRVVYDLVAGGMIVATGLRLWNMGTRALGGPGGEDE